MSIELLAAFEAGDLERAQALADLSERPMWENRSDWLGIRARQIENDPGLQQWLLRAMVERDTRRMVGHIGFHTAPDADYLREFGLDGGEFGYGVFEHYRRRGYAREAAHGLMRWAHETHGVTSFVLSIGPDNLASTALAKSMGYKKVASHIDPKDGPEDIFHLRYPEELTEG